MAYNIETGFPMPLGGKRSKYPFERMEVGDSFSIATPDGADAWAHAAALRAAAYTWGARHNREFKVRLDEQKTLARVWRVA